ncbi:hypothetical protein C8R44DRAFT_772670, partial [Mycena epipterygia]
PPPPESSTPAISWEAFYPKGSINPSAPLPGGFGFYLSGPSAFASKLESGATHVILSYRMMLQSDWEWVKAENSLEYVFGGEGDFSYACTGGRQDNRCKCLMFGRCGGAYNGLGELYKYLSSLLAVPSSSKENSDYGFSVGRSAFNFDVAVGEWASLSLAFRVKLNAIGCDDGELELWVNGKSVIKVLDLTLRESERSRVQGAHFQTFFWWTSRPLGIPKDHRAWFTDLTGVVIE